MPAIEPDGNKQSSNHSEHSRHAELYLGIMSGTSLDGIDVGLFQFDDNAIATIAHEHIAYSNELRTELKSLCESKTIEPEALMRADATLATLSAQCVNTLLTKENLGANSVKAIGSHGQTIRHVPPGRQVNSQREQSHTRGYTWQIGDPSTIAALTNILVVADFRRADMARGGQGAPLAPAFHQAAFGSDRQTAVVNIGGMSNISVLGFEDVIGFDCGPGNALMDAWILQHHNKSFDEDGQWAASGTVHEALFKRLFEHEFFSAPPPKSTGREQFNKSWLDGHLSELEPIPGEDVQATLLELTARCIAGSVQRDWQLETMMVCGGGAYNKALMKRLAELLPGVTVGSSATMGIEPELVECCAFAWFAQQTLAQKPIQTKAFTGAQQDSILGGIYPV